MEYIVFSDIHFYKNYSRSYLREDGMTSWLYNQFKSVDQIFDYARINNIELIIFNGDMFEQKNHLPQDLYNAVWDYFRKQSDTFCIIMNTGNHDFHNRNSSSLRPFYSFAQIIIKPSYIHEDGLFMIPFGMITDKIPPANVLFIHEDINGLKYGKECRSRSLIEPSLFDRFPLVLNGHIHIPQTMGRNIINLGSCMKHEFGEVGDRYFYHFNGTELLNQVKVNCPDFIDIKGLSSKIKKSIVEDNYNYYRIDIAPEELSDEIFKRFNVTPNIIKQNKKREVRLKKNMTIEEEMNELIKQSETNLNVEKLIDIGKELINADS